MLLATQGLAGFLLMKIKSLEIEDVTKSMTARSPMRHAGEPKIRSSRWTARG
jgi:hypothetical protein